MKKIIITIIVAIILGLTIYLTAENYRSQDAPKYNEPVENLANGAL